MLKIPRAGDRPEPLVVPMKIKPGAEKMGSPDEGGAISSKSLRRKKRGSTSQKHAWESMPATATQAANVPERVEKRQMFWMLLGGGALFCLIVAGVMLALFSTDQTPPPAVVKSAPKPAPVISVPNPDEVAKKQDIAFTAEAEPIAKKFMEATRVEEILPLIRNPAATEAKLRRHYPDGSIPPLGMLKFNVNGQIFHQETISSLVVRTRDYDLKTLNFVKSPDGIKIDWESFIGWSDMPWKEFMATRPTSPQIFRVFLSPVEYYNVAFTDDKKWQSYLLTSPDDAHAIYGYVERASELNQKIQLPAGGKAALILSLQFPDAATSSNQVLIKEALVNGWILEPKN